MESVAFNGPRHFPFRATWPRTTLVAPPQRVSVTSHGGDMISLLDPHRWGPYTVVGIMGEVDVASAPALRDKALALLNRGTDALVLDLRGVTFMDSTGVGSLLRIHHRASLLGATVHFIVDQPSVLRVLDVMQLRRRLHVAPSVAAIASCCGDAAVAEDPSRQRAFS